MINTSFKKKNNDFLFACGRLSVCNSSHYQQANFARNLFSMLLENSFLGIGGGGEKKKKKKEIVFVV